jgi:hypothetical protein
MSKEFTTDQKLAWLRASFAEVTVGFADDHYAGVAVTHDGASRAVYHASESDCVDALYKAVQADLEPAIA